MVKNKVIKGNGLTVASFFSGAGGFDLGFQKAGFNIVMANDIWKDAARTFINNHPDVHFIEDDIKNITFKTIKRILKERNIEKIDVLIGGPPCQCFTRLNNNNLRKDDERNQLFRDYMRMVRILKPPVVVMENVADLLVRQNTKGQNFRDIIIRSFNRNGYRAACKIMETERYNVPQRRRRVIFIATRSKGEIVFPSESKRLAKVKHRLKKLNGNNKLANHEITENERHVLTRIKHIPPGGYYEQLPRHLKVKKVRNGKLVTVKRYGSYYRRLNNEEPAITITNNYIIHPTEHRYLTNREKAVLHTFPVNYAFEGSRESVSQQIANAVPPELARRIAVTIKDNYFA